jgi:ring-1,2-phenylacetyl-CoA epoxidase subunit PaaE
MGKFFTPLNAQQKKHYLAFAAGSGITPIISLIKTTLAIEPYSKYTLLYGNKTRQTILFKNEIEALKNKYMERFHVLFVFSKEITDAAIQQGRLDEQKCEQIFTHMIPVTADEYFICGPEAMMTCIHNFLLSKNISNAHIHFELFTTPGQIHTPSTATSNLPTEKTEQQCEINLKIDGAWHQIYANTNVSILEALLQYGFDLPYSCKGGVCATCKAQLLEGKVTLKQNYALEPDEIKQGYILTCQAYALTNKLSVNFDIK